MAYVDQWGPWLGRAGGGLVGQGCHWNQAGPYGAFPGQTPPPYLLL